MPIRIGVNPICWSNDDMPELGGGIPLEQCLSEAKAAGYEGIELGHKFPRQPVTLKSVLDPHQLALVGRLVFDPSARAGRGEASSRKPKII